jgi:hypothetical protein
VGVYGSSLQTTRKLSELSFIRFFVFANEARQQEKKREKKEEKSFRKESPKKDSHQRSERDERTGWQCKQSRSRLGAVVDVTINKTNGQKNALSWAISLTL